MDINSQMQQLNNFSGGMNSDTSDAYLKSDSYRLALNLRYITNNEENSGEMHIIEGGLELFRFDEEVVAMGDIRDYGVAITKDLNGKFSIWRIDHNSDDETPKRIFGPCSETLANNYTDKISINLNYEASDNIKLYIADGQHPIMLINIMEENEEIPTDFDYISSRPDCLLDTPIFCGLVSGVLEGGVYQYAYRLYNKYKQASEMSPVTKLIPVHTGSAMFADGKQIDGCEEGKPSGKGIQLKLNIPENSSFDRYLVYRIKYVENGLVPTVELISDAKLYNNSQITFIDSGQSALDTLTLEEFNSITGIHIIPKIIESKEGWMFASNIKTDDELDSDPEIKAWDARAYRFKHDGSTTIYDYVDSNNSISFSIEDIPDIPEEFDCYSPYNDINNEFIRSDYKYAPCIEDPSLMVYGGAGKNITWNFITTHVTGDSCISGEADTYYHDAGTAYNYISLDSRLSTNLFKKWYIYDQPNVEPGSFERESWNNTSNNNDTYANPVISYEFKSLRRNELYRYGIILYNSKGETSSVKWIADIRTPSISESCTFVSHYGPEGNDKQYDLSTRPLGIEFKVSNLPEGVVGYEIVRCSRGFGDIATISLGVLNKPSIQYKRQSDYKTNLPLMPTGWITTGGLRHSVKPTYNIFNVDADWGNGDYPLAYGFQAFNYNIKAIVKREDSGSTTYKSEYITQINNDTFEFISPEVNYLNQSIRDVLTSSTKISPEMFLFGCAYNYDTPENDYRHKYDGDPNTGITAGYDNDRETILYNRLIFPGPKYTTLCASKTSQNDNQFVSETESGAETIAKNAQIETNGGLYIDDGNYNLLNSENSFARVVLIPNTFVYSFLYSEKPANPGDNIDYNYYSDHYSYIKLYELSQDVITKKNDYSLLYCNYGSNRDGGTKAESVDYLNLRNLNKNFNIKDLTYNTTHTWDGFATYDSEHNSDILNYTDYLSPVGDKNHLDWIVSSLYGIKILYAWDLDDNQELTAWGLGGLIGPSDRYALIQLDNKDGDLMQTVAAFTRKCKDEDGYGYIVDKNAPESPVSGTTLDRVCIPNPASFSDDPQGTFVDVFRESMLGTYLCNIRHDVIPYGGYTHQDRLLNTYSSYGDFVRVSGNSNVSQVFDGDCYIQPFEYMSMHRGYYYRLKYFRNHTIVYSIPVETNINLAYTYGSEFSKVRNVNLQVDATNVNNIFVQQDDMYVYNSVYSLNSTSRLHASMITDDDVDINVYDYRTYYSDTKINNEYIDSWIKYRSSNYLDVDTRFGAISGLRLFHNQLVYWQEEATGVFSVNERALIDSAIETNAPLQLGTGGTLARYDYLATSNGMKLDELCDTQSDTTLYWWDHDKAEICAYAGEKTVVSLSKIKNVLNFINDRKIEQRLSECPYLTFDKKYSELIANVTDGTAKNSGSLVYSEITQQFVGLYNIHPTYGMRFSDSIYMSDKNIVGRWNTYKDYMSSWLNASLTPYLKFPVNDTMQEVKVFDNMRIGGRLYLHLKSNLRDTGYLSPIKFVFHTPLKQKSSCNGSSLTNAEYDYRLAIPRNNNDAFGGRMRGKTMETEISSTSNSMDFSLQYVITKYRISWS